MNEADLNLCKELCELSGWNKTDKYHEVEASVYVNKMPQDWDIIPAYDCGYLLRKLPAKHIISSITHSHDYQLQLKKWSSGKYSAAYYFEGGNNCDSDWLADAEDKSPENALCKLAIELFKQGILTKEEK